MLHLKPYFLVMLLLTLMGSGFLLSACGQTGDLYLPEEDSQLKKEKSTS
jgi:predicted small lipoprotein YifL